MTQTMVADAQADVNSIVAQLTPPVFTAHVWRSAWVSTKKYQYLDALVSANQPFVADGCVLEQTNVASPMVDGDAGYWLRSTSDGAGLPAGYDGQTLSTHPITGVTNYRVAMLAKRVGINARLVVKFGATDPTSFTARVVGAAIT